MQYLGGKSKIRKELSAFLKSIRKENQTYLEPFIGGGWILQEMDGVRIGGDGNEALINLYKAVQDGWVPPDFVSEETWRKYKQNPDPKDPMTAFCRIGCGFGGDWNGGYARSEGKTCYAATSMRSLLKQKPHIQDVELHHKLFHQWKPENMLVYCDPPYQNTTNYGAFDGFDHALFWETMREWSKNNTVVISEYNAPNDFVCVKTFQSRMGLCSGAKGNRVIREEKLFIHESLVNAPN